MVKIDAQENFTGNLQVVVYKDDQKVLATMESIDLLNYEQMMEYGSKPQKDLGIIAQEILQETTTSEVGEHGESLNKILEEMKDLEKSGKKISFLEKWLNIGKKTIINKLNGFQSVVSQLDKIENELQQRLLDLKKELKVLTQMQKAHFEKMKELEVYIIAGEQKLEEAQGTIKDLKTKMEEIEKDTTISDDEYNNQMKEYQNKLIHLNKSCFDFKKKLHTLVLTRTVSEQAIPHLELTINDNRQLYDTILNIIHHSIPLWKGQITITMANLSHKKTQEVVKGFTERTNHMLEQNAIDLEQTAIAVATQNAQGVIDESTLIRVNESLAKTVEEVTKIYMQTEAKQRESRKQLALSTEKRNKKIAEIYKQSHTQLGYTNSTVKQITQ